MIADPRQSLILSTLPWAERNALWIYQTASGQVEKIAIPPSAVSLELIEGDGGFFGLIQVLGQGRTRFTLRHFDSPLQDVASFAVDGTRGLVPGSPELWSYMPQAFIHRGLLMRLISNDGQWRLLGFPWFDDSYAHNAQAPIHAVAIPGQSIVVVAVARSSSLIVFDPDSEKILGKVTLPVDSASPRIRFCHKTGEFWASAAARLFRISPQTWEITGSLSLQTPHWVGDWNFCRDEAACAVPRTFSGDVLVIDVLTFQITGRSITGGQPIEATALTNDRVIARDWKAGSLLHGAPLQPLVGW